MLIKRLGSVIFHLNVLAGPKMVRGGIKTLSPLGQVLFAIYRSGTKLKLLRFTLKEIHIFEMPFEFGLTNINQIS
jgi:hypothetical protein